MPPGSRRALSRPGSAPHGASDPGGPAGHATSCCSDVVAGAYCRTKANVRTYDGRRSHSRQREHATNGQCPTLAAKQQALVRGSKESRTRRTWRQLSPGRIRLPGATLSDAQTPTRNGRNRPGQASIKSRRPFWTRVTSITQPAASAPSPPPDVSSHASSEPVRMRLKGRCNHPDAKRVVLNCASS